MTRRVFGGREAPSGRNRSRPSAGWGAGGGEWVLAGLALMVAAVSALVLLGGAVWAMLTGGGWTWPAGSDLLRTVAGVVGHPGMPAAGYPPALQPRIPGPVPFWITVGLLAGVLVILTTTAVVAMWGRRPPSGSLTRVQMRQAMTHTHLLAPFGRYHGIPVQGQPGDAAICIAPQQAGETTRLAIGRVADAPGACLVTSTKADIVDATVYVRHNTAAADTRRVWVFDPDEVAGWPAECRWDMVAGCDDPAEAMRRAAAMTAAKPLGRGGNAEFFADACRTVLRCLLPVARRSADPGRVDAGGDGVGAQLRRRHPVHHPAGRPAR